MRYSNNAGTPLRDFAHLKDQPALLAELVEDKTSYGETFLSQFGRAGMRPGRMKTATWFRLSRTSSTISAIMLNKAIAAVEDENDSLAGVLKNNIDFNAVKGKIPDRKWKDLRDHFNQPGFVLVNDSFEFPDLLRAAYEYLIKYFADSAGKKGGEFLLRRRLCVCNKNKPDG